MRHYHNALITVVCSLHPQCTFTRAPYCKMFCGFHDRPRRCEQQFCRKFMRRAKGEQLGRFRLRRFCSSKCRAQGKAEKLSLIMYYKNHTDEKKFCTFCKEWKWMSSLYWGVDKAKADGLKNWCKACRKLESKIKYMRRKYREEQLINNDIVGHIVSDS